MVDHSDQNLSSNSHVSEHWVHNAGKSQAPHTLGSNHAVTDRNHINSQILAQLSVLGVRMNSMESSLKTARKTNDSTKSKKSKVKTKATVTHTGSKGVGAASLPVQMVHNIPPPSQLREEARVQE